MSCQQPQAHPDRCGCAPHGTEQVSSAWLAQLREEYRQFGEQNALLIQRCRNLEAVQQASLERSGTIKAAAGQLGWTADREDGPLEFLIKQARRCGELVAEINRQAEQFREWQASHHANYAAVAEERDALRAKVERLRPPAGHAPYPDQIKAWQEASQQDLARCARLEAKIERLMSFLEDIRTQLDAGLTPSIGAIDAAMEDCR